MTTDRERQKNELRDAVRAGWQLYRNWEKIKARYEDRDLADQVPRAVIYIDLGTLCGYIRQLEDIIRALGWQIERFDDALDDEIIERILQE